MNRRDLLKGMLMSASALALRPVFAQAQDASGKDVAAQLAALERRHGGRLGVAAIDTDSGRQALYRADERFLICSTFKLLAVAAVLARVDRGAERLDRRIVFGQEVVLSYAPITSHRVGAPGMSVSELCDAAITLSDNTAANLLLQSLGGPSAVTAYARGLGDSATRLDHIEPDLNMANGEQDTTTPAAMLADMRRVLLGDVLSAASRRQLTDWLVASQTGPHALRAGLPPDWRVGDKTGSGQDANNDIAIAWPPRRGPLLVTSYYINHAIDSDGRTAVLAEVARIVASLSAPKWARQGPVALVPSVR